jgi:putative hydrolase of the HAD superfamily
MAFVSRLDFRLHNIRAVTLDLDDTLWEIGPVIRRAEADLWSWLGANCPRIAERWNASDLAALRQSLFDEFPDRTHDFRFLRKMVIKRVAIDSGYGEEVVDPAFEVFDTARNKVELFPEVTTELRWLADKYVLIAITNGNANLHTIGIADMFDDVISSAVVGVAKPARQIFDTAIQRAGVTPREVLHVGDHAESDIEGARNAGMRTVWVNRTSAEWPGHLDTPDATVEDISGVRALLAAAAGSIRD